MLSSVLQRLPVKPFMVGYVGLVLLVGVWGTGQVRPLLQAIVILGLYTVADILWTKLRDHQTYVPLSSVISGLIGGVVLNPVSPWWVVVAFPLIAVAGKQLLHVKGKHIFNPVAFGLITLSFLHPAAISWWGVAWWSAIPKTLAVLVGIVILMRIRRFHVTLSFLLVYSVGLGLILLRSGSSWGTLSLPFLFDGTLIFFATVMLVEPVTTAYRTKRIQVAYGAGVGLLAVFAPLIGVPLPDGFLPPLLLGNLAAALASSRHLRGTPAEIPSEPKAGLP